VDLDKGLVQATQRGMDFGDQLTGQLGEGMLDSMSKLTTLIAMQGGARQFPEG